MNKKRIFSAALAAVLALTTLPALSAQAAQSEAPLAEKAAVLKELEIMVGDQTGNLNLTSPVTRAEFVKLLVAASPYQDNVSTTAGTDPYPDVSHKSWYAPYVRLAVDMELVQGDLTGYFHPEDTITLAEGVTMAVRLLGYADSDFTSPWPGGQMGLYKALELDKGLTAADSGDTLTRQDCLHLFYNLLTVKTKSGSDYIQLLGYSLNSDGQVDVNSVFDADVNGPIPVTDGWESLLPFSVRAALVYRDGERASLDELKDWDLVYWLDDPALLIVDSSQSMSALSAAVEGPIEVKEGWESKLPFPLSETVNLTRNGSRATLSDLKEGDLVYYSEYSKSLAVYAKTVTGTVEAVTPTLAQPTAVVIAGQSYALETLEAQYAFSDLGAFQKGDTVTLRLGRGGGAAAVTVPKEEETLTQWGILAALSYQNYTDSSDQTYASRTVSIVAADGKTYVYPYAAGAVKESQFETGDLVEVTLTGGTATLKKLSGATLSGKVNATATKLGDLSLSPDVEILDTYGDSTFRAVAPSRLEGVTLARGDVRHYTTDEAGSIDRLILKDVTGDCHRYGVLTDKETVDVAMILQGAYTVDLSGVSQIFSVSGKSFTASLGPVVVKEDSGAVKDIRSLTKAANATLTGQKVSSGGKTLTLADDAAFYFYDTAEKAYTLATRAQVEGGNYTLSAWYDKTDSQRGRVRVIVAQAK